MLSPELWSLCLGFCDARALARACQVSRSMRALAEHDTLWRPLCAQAGVTGAGEGSRVPGRRTYVSWAAAWRNSRCAECGNACRYRINLDGGSCAATMFHGAKVSLCRQCAELAAECYFLKGHRVALVDELLPRLVRRVGRLGALVCGCNAPIAESVVRKNARARAKSASSARVEQSDARRA